jgi:hypothetical protein
MPRKRKASRAYRQPRLSVREEIRQRFAPGSLNLVLLPVQSFHEQLPTEAERDAFADEYPEIFYYLFGFESSVYDQYPALVENATGCCVFRRWDFATEFLRANPARFRFVPPDLHGLKYIEQLPAMARARADWWEANGWEMTEAERQWLLVGPLKPAHGDTVTPPPFHPRRTDIPNIVAMPPAKETIQ